MCLLSQAGQGLTLWSGCPQTCQSLATASCAGIVGMSAMPSSWWLFYIIALLCFAKEMHAWSRKMVQWAKTLVSRPDDWSSSPGFTKWEESPGSQELSSEPYILALACVCPHLHVSTHINLKCFGQTFLGDVWRPWKANVADLHYCPSERTSYLESTRLQRVPLSKHLKTSFCQLSILGLRITVSNVPILNNTVLSPKTRGKQCWLSMCKALGSRSLHKIQAEKLYCLRMFTLALFKIPWKHPNFTPSAIWG